MNKITTLEKVNGRVNEMSKYCHDKYVHLSDISFDSLEIMKIGSDRHTLRPIAQRSITWRLGILNVLAYQRQRYQFIHQ